MGLLNLFKKKQQPEITNPSESGRSYIGDLEKTKMIFELIDVPVGSRDGQWQSAFLENIVQASFRFVDPQVIIGPDGFPYFQLLMPKPNEAFQCYVIERMKDDFLLKLGYGVVIW